MSEDLEVGHAVQPDQCTSPKIVHVVFDSTSVRAIQLADIVISGGSQGGSRFGTVGPGSISLWTQTSLWGSGLEICWAAPQTAGQV